MHGRGAGGHVARIMIETEVEGQPTCITHRVSLRRLVCDDYEAIAGNVAISVPCDRYPMLHDHICCRYLLQDIMINRYPATDIITDIDVDIPRKHRISRGRSDFEIVARPLCPLLYPATQQGNRRFHKGSALHAKLVRRVITWVE